MSNINILEEQIRETAEKEAQKRAKAIMQKLTDVLFSELPEIAGESRQGMNLSGATRYDFSTEVADGINYRAVNDALSKVREAFLPTLAVKIQERIAKKLIEAAA